MAVPEWVISQRRDRGLCERCGGPGESYWQSARGPLLCWPHIEAERAAYDDRRQGR